MSQTLSHSLFFSLSLSITLFHCSTLFYTYQSRTTEEEKKNNKFQSDLNLLPKLICLREGTPTAGASFHNRIDRMLDLTGHRCGGKNCFSPYRYTRPGTGNWTPFRWLLFYTVPNYHRSEWQVKSEGNLLRYLRTYLVVCRAEPVALGHRMGRRATRTCKSNRIARSRGRATE